MTARFATKEDAEAGRKFIVITVDVSHKGLKIGVDNEGIVLRKIGRENTWRFGPFGAREWVELGVVRLSNAGGYSFTGQLIDYIENRDMAIEAAKKFAEDKRIEFIKGMQQQILEMTQAKLTVVTGL